MPTILSTHPHDKARAAYLGELALGELKMMKFVSKTRNFVSETRNCVSKTRKFAFTMMNFAEKGVAYHAAGCGHVSEQVLRMGRRALLEKEAAARHSKLQAKE